jgi:hypothetical protein
VDHKPLICGSLIAVRGKASTPLNTIIMFVPQQEVNMDIFNFYIAISVTNNVGVNYQMIREAVTILFILQNYC